MDASSLSPNTTEPLNIPANDDDNQVSAGTDFTRAKKRPAFLDLDPIDQSFKIEGKNINCERFEAKNPIAEYYFCGGFLSETRFIRKQIAKLNDYGITVVAMELPDIGKAKSFMPFYTKAAHHFFTKIPSLGNPDLPKAFGGHSTGGTLAKLLYGMPAIRNKLNSIYKAAINISPYYEKSGASQEFEPKRHRIFEARARKYPDLVIKDDPTANKYLTAMGWLGKKSDKDARNLTYAQIQHLTKYGLKAIKKMQDNPPEIYNDLKQFTVAGMQDTASCIKSIKKMCGFSDEVLIPIEDCGHNALAEDMDNAHRLAGLILYSTDYLCPLKPTLQQQEEVAVSLLSTFTWFSKAPKPETPTVWQRPWNNKLDTDNFLKFVHSRKLENNTAVG